MCDRLKSVFGNTFGNQQLGNAQAAISSEPLDIKQESFYNDYGTNYGTEDTYMCYSSGYGPRGHGRANRHGGGCRAPWGRSQREGQGRIYDAGTCNPLRKNPVDKTGHITRCTVCKSIYHWMRGCLHHSRRQPLITFTGFTNSSIQE